MSQPIITNMMGITTADTGRIAGTRQQAMANTNSRLHTLLDRISNMVMNGPWPSRSQRSPIDNPCSASPATRSPRKVLSGRLPKTTAMTASDPDTT